MPDSYIRPYRLTWKSKRMGQKRLTLCLVVRYFNHLARFVCLFDLHVNLILCISGSANAGWKTVSQGRCRSRKSKLRGLAAQWKYVPPLFCVQLHRHVPERYVDPPQPICMLMQYCTA